RRLVRERDVVELELRQVVHRDGARGLRVDRYVENFLIGRERCFRLAVDVDDVAELLQRSKDEEGVDQERKELPDRDLLVEDQVEHQEQNRGPNEVDARSLDEAQRPDVADLSQLELENLVRRRIQPLHFLIGQSEAFDELDVSQRFSCRAG